MIVGSGSIADLLNDRLGFCFFAAGVSDSSIEGDQHPDIDREFGTLINAAEYCNELGLMFVYFSSISIFYTQSRYTLHKLATEDFIKANFGQYIIIRLGNIWECRNPNTFINKMQYWDRQDKLLPSMIRDEWKYMTSKKQLNFITDNLPLTGQHEISIFGEMKKVKDCL
jgi:hypothetical protein